MIRGDWEDAESELQRGRTNVTASLAIRVLAEGNSPTT
jgi:hypothetical protein